ERRRPRWARRVQQRAAATGDEDRLAPVDAEGIRVGGGGRPGTRDRRPWTPRRSVPRPDPEAVVRRPSNDVEVVGRWGSRRRRTGDGGTERLPRRPLAGLVREKAHLAVAAPPDHVEMRPAPRCGV